MTVNPDSADIDINPLVAAAAGQGLLGQARRLSR
jgi:hypothetical protein